MGYTPLLSSHVGWFGVYRGTYPEEFNEARQIRFSGNQKESAGRGSVHSAAPCGSVCKTQDDTVMSEWQQPRISPESIALGLSKEVA